MRRRLRGALPLAALALAAALGAGCPAAHPDYPDRSCKVPADCFAGEACISGTCVDVDMGAAVDALVDQAGDAE